MTDNTNAKMLAMQKEHGPLLEVKDLAIDFTTDTGKPVHAVRDANFTVYPGQWVAIVGESGSGKSTSAMAVLGLLPGTGHVVNGSSSLTARKSQAPSRASSTSCAAPRWLSCLGPDEQPQPGVAHRIPRSRKR